ncbi:unnamed protein product [Ectocarpus sp. CCAP 1310/34]|nr:unnamed protein product [Ectocarpus sp. CCAP 1310/34]
MPSSKGRMLSLVLVCPTLCSAFLCTRRSLSSLDVGRTTKMSAAVTGRLADKVYLVTGSTDGIGKHTASRLAEEGATVLVHGRREAAVREAVEHVGGGKGKVEGIVADLSSLRGANHLCDEVLRRTDRLDCLLNNAGVFEADFRHSDDGLEYTFAVNVLAPYVITGRLLDLLAKAPGGGRVVNVASLSASYSLDFDNLQFEKGGYSDHASYSLSKLLDIMFNAELARRAPKGVTCNSLDPGTVNTKMLRAGWGMGGIPVKSANDQFYLATSDDVSDSSGEYYVSRRVTTPPPPAEDEEACRRLWGVLEELSGFNYA